jgi:hypothetical protein
MTDISWASWSSLASPDFTVVQSASELQIDALETVGTGLTGQGNAVIRVGES